YGEDIKKISIGDILSNQLVKKVNKLLNESCDIIIKNPAKSLACQLENYIWKNLIYNRIEKYRNFFEKISESESSKTISERGKETRYILTKSIIYYKNSAVKVEAVKHKDKKHFKVILSKFYSYIGDLYRYMAYIGNSNKYDVKLLSMAKIFYNLSYKEFSSLSSQFFSLGLIAFME
ncbi:MAG: hypothetical protein MHPSP_002316, partial [Paramarteilia canceri]